MVYAPPPPSDGPNRLTSTSQEADRGVSEVVSFILTFAIITTMIGLLYSGGFVSLERLQTGNQMQNAEGVFFAMADSFGELQEGQAPKRAGALDLDVGASIAISNESEIEVEVNDASGPVFSERLVTRSMDYRLDERAVTYETGAVFRSNDGGSVLVGEPSGLICSPSTDSAVVSVVTLVDPNDVSVASGTVTVTGIQRSTTLLYPTDRTAPGTIDNVTVDIDAPREAAWHSHLEGTTAWTDPDDDGTFVCRDIDQVFVRHTVIEVRVSA